MEVKAFSKPKPSLLPTGLPKNNLFGPPNKVSMANVIEGKSIRVGTILVCEEELLVSNDSY